jgi:predicted nucleic acid-binding protein
MAIAWLFDDERTEAAHSALRRVIDEGAIVPSLWRLEMANMLRNAVRRGRCDEGYADASIDRLTKLPIKVDAETDDHAWGATRVLAREHDLTLYDAAYLELALRLTHPLATCDDALIEAAKQRNLPVLSA